MRSISLSILFLILIVACEDTTEGPSIEYFSVSISPQMELIDISEVGRTTSGAEEIYTDVYYFVYDSLCEDVVAEGMMVYDSTIPPLVFPNLPAGKYFYNIDVRGEEGIAYDSAASFVLESDTVIETVLTNKQFRFKFEDTSNFSDTGVNYINFLLNFSTIYIPNLNKCTDSLIWTGENYEGYVDNSSYQPYATGFYYSFPIDLTSVQLKFYDESGFLLKSHIIPLEKELEKQYSYTFEVDISSIWSGEEDGNRFNFTIEEVPWFEETIQVN
ncbi:hypothetical protein SAMN05421640_3757 [Ekhidna lutea]|uniref:Uncharacterized protein n=1 Tax=Ekhidna lutea TaxID=447679 RepID=A0A239MBT7_EKHLU|nr:hypothetical protein [Ekhidna lutea]SNT39632.1 hypothetical protein SAMN05421640_3757 [Ekhidna lutea]